MKSARNDLVDMNEEIDVEEIDVEEIDIEEIDKENVYNPGIIT